MRNKKMKRLSIIIVVLFIITMPSAFGQFIDLTGEKLAGVYLSYAFGMGDPFKDYEDQYFKVTTSAGIGFGGTFYYGLKEKIMIGGELMFQRYGGEVESKPGAPAIFSGSGGASSTELSFLANGLYALSHDDETAFFLCGGAGLYDYGGMKLGLNAGVFYRKMVSDKIYVYGSPRFHLVFADATFELLQIAVGVQMMLGDKM
jgi:hypothetical protein